MAKHRELPPSQAVSPFEKAVMVFIGICTGIIVGYCVMETAEVVFAKGAGSHLLQMPTHV